MAWKFIKSNRGYRYFFDIDAPGDDNGAFHSSDLRYFFGTLDKSFRPYGEKDKAASELIMDYVAAFVRTGNPNGEGRPLWKKGGKPLYISKGGFRMKRANPVLLIRNTFRGDPK